MFTTNIESIKLLPAIRLNERATDSCTSGDLKILQLEAQRLLPGVQWECVENSNTLRHLICVQNDELLDFFAAPKLDVIHGTGELV